MKLSNLQPSFPGSFQYIGPLFRVDEPVPLTPGRQFPVSAKLISCFSQIYYALTKHIACFI